MMSKERALLQEVLDQSYFDKDTVMADIFNRITKLLAQPETITPPKREPLSDEEIFAIGYKAGLGIVQDENADDGSEVYGFLNENGYVDNEPYFKFVRAIEKAHGIGGSDE